jgi:hypothetical protein
MYSTMFKEKEMTKETHDLIVKIERQISNKEIPEFYPSEMVNNYQLGCCERRSKFIKQIGFTLISNDWIKPLSQWIGNRKCLEVMAGTGALSFALQKQNINIKATDDFSWKNENSWNADKNYWTEIENIDAIEAVIKYGKDINILVMSWAYMDDVAYRVLKTMREVNPFCVMICIGEGHGGCTADDEFFDNVITIEDEEFEKSVSNFKQWWGIHDYPQLFK